MAEVATKLHSYAVRQWVVTAVWLLLKWYHAIAINSTRKMDILHLQGILRSINTRKQKKII